jgi:ketosteroid isomerase-like protein
MNARAHGATHLDRMNPATDAARTPLDIIRAHDEAWKRKDVDGVVALFASDATIESPLVARLTGKPTARGRDEVRAAVQAVIDRGVVWGRHEPPAVRGDTVFVEYRRETPDGEQGDSVDVITVQGGLIKSLRAYLGAKSVASLAART